MSIRSKLVLMQVFTSVVVLLIMFLVFIITDVKSFKQRKIDNIMSIAQVVGSNSISALQFQDRDAATEMLTQLHTVSPEIIEASIFNKKGQLFAGYSATGSLATSVPAGLKEKDFLFLNKKLFVSYPIFSNKELVGKVFLAVTLTELQNNIKSKYQLSFILILVALGFSFLLANFIQSYVSKRLLALVNIMKKVNNTGNYNTPIVDEGKDEIAVLIQVFNKLMAQIKENTKKKDEFIGIASHELKTPLTTIKGYLEMLTLMENEQPNKQFVDSAYKNVLKLEELVKDLLDVSKIESGQLQLEKEEFDVSQLINEAIDSSQMISSTHSIVRKDQLEKEMVFGDRKRIEQVLTNLLSNAIKYSPGEHLITVELEKKEREFIIKVRDFGIGIPEEEHSFIFNRFYRTKGSSVHISGFGLGLYICSDIVNRHNGKIWIKSMEKGTVFNFSLPMPANTYHAEK